VNQIKRWHRKPRQLRELTDDAVQARRLALLEWALRNGSLVIEDDYDSEFHGPGRPVESIQGLDRAGRVLYIGTFSTVLFPPLRVGYVVLPPSLVEPFVRAKWLADRQTPTLEQLALTDFLEKFLVDPLLNRTFGGCMKGSGMVAADERTLRSGRPAAHQRLDIHVLTAQSTTPADWLEQLAAIVKANDGVELETARRAHLAGGGSSGSGWTNWWICSSTSSQRTATCSSTSDPGRTAR
jgi:DNA-binding transcriptional MocR family regulator